MRSVDLLNTPWKKSSYSAANGDCVETSLANGCVGVRDSKNPAQPALWFRPAQWQGFISAIKRDDRDGA